jgi:hypothetical protein
VRRVRRRSAWLAVAVAQLVTRSEDSALLHRASRSFQRARASFLSSRKADFKCCGAGGTRNNRGRRRGARRENTILSVSHTGGKDAPLLLCSSRKSPFSPLDSMLRPVSSHSLCPAVPVVPGSSLVWWVSSKAGRAECPGKKKWKRRKSERNRVARVLGPS